MGITTMNDPRLWQLISPSLPVGAYAYSAGLESAIDRGFVTDAQSCTSWLTGMLSQSFTYNDLPVFFALYDLWLSEDSAAIVDSTKYLQSLRETAELLAEDRQTGKALQRLLIDLDMADAETIPQPSYATMFALACVRWQIDVSQGALGLAWSWLENQVAAAIKLVPLGQTDGQRMLLALTPELHAAVATAAALNPNDIGRSLPGLALLSSGHEQQYSRLFRS
jgi:urease accessory protein